MRRPDHVRIRHIATVALTSALAVGSLPGATTATEEEVTTLPRCAGLEASGPASGRLTSPWQTELDKEGTVIGHRLTLRRDGREDVGELLLLLLAEGENASADMCE